MITLPSIFKRLTYRFSSDSGRYVVESGVVGFTRVPPELLVEERRAAQIQADLVIRSTDTEPHRFFTGLRQLGEGTLYYGNHGFDRPGGKKVRNLTVFRFSRDTQHFSMLYFPGFYPRISREAMPDFIREMVGRGMI